MTAERTRALAFCHPSPPRRLSVGVLAAGVVADGVDLVGRDVELVVAPVLEQQVVALDAADGPLHHAGVAGDAVVVVHDVVAGLEVVEEAGRVALARAGLAVGAAPAGEVGLGEHRQLEAGRMQPRSSGATSSSADDAVAGEQLAQPRRRALAVGGHDDPVAVALQARRAGGRRARDRRRRRPRPST